MLSRLFRAFRHQQNDRALPGIALEIVETPDWRLGTAPGSGVDELEIGATGHGQLQFVLISQRRRATIKLSAEQARWLAGALNHWATSSETIETS